MTIQGPASSFDDLMMRLRKRRREAVGGAGQALINAHEPSADGYRCLLNYVTQLHAFNSVIEEVGEMIGEAKVQRERRDDAEDQVFDDAAGGEAGDVPSF